MPKFYAGGTSIKLSAIKLQDTITEQPTVNKSIQSTLNVKQAEDAFSKSGVDGGFAENAIEDEETQSHMRFLGRSRDMPFFLVHAKERTFEDENSTHSHSDPRNDGSRKDHVVSQGMSSPSQAAALCLSLSLTEKSYTNSEGAMASRKTFHDLKADVYLNGSLTDSCLLPARNRASHVFRFTGRRIKRLIEKPWVIHNRAQTIKQNGRTPPVVVRSSGYRWATVSKALMAELDQHGDPPPGETFVSADYFQTLTEMELPLKVRGLDQPNGSRLGIIDVLVTFGEGSKFGPDTPYLTGPTPIRILTPSQNRPAYLRPTPKHPQAKTNEEAFQIHKATGEAAVESISATRSSRLYGVAGSLGRRDSPEAPNRPSTSYLQRYIESSGSMSKEEALAALHDLPPLIARKPKWQTVTSVIHMTETNAESNPHETKRLTESNVMEQGNDNVPISDDIISTNTVRQQGAKKNLGMTEGNKDNAMNTLDPDIRTNRGQGKSPDCLEPMPPETSQILCLTEETSDNESEQPPQGLPVDAQKPSMDDNSNIRDNTAYAQSTQSNFQKHCSQDAPMTEVHTGHLPSQYPLSIEPSTSRTSRQASISTNCAFNFSDNSSSLSSPPPSTTDSRQSSPDPTQWHTIKVPHAPQSISDTTRKVTERRTRNAQWFDGAFEPKPTSVPPDKRYAVGDNEGIWAETRRPNQPSGFGQFKTPRLTRSTSLLSDESKSRTNAVSQPKLAKRTAPASLLAPRSHTSSSSSFDKHEGCNPTEATTTVIKGDSEASRNPDSTAKWPGSIASTPADRRTMRISKSTVTSTRTSRKRSLNTLADEERKPSEKRKSSSVHPALPPDDVSDKPKPIYDTDFEPGEMNENCIIGYAEPGMVRNVHTRRGGWFKEKGVLMGVRFLLW